MSNLNVVTWSLQLLPENAAKIDQVNQILLGSQSSANAPVENAKNSVKEKTSSTKEKSTETPSATLKNLQNAAKAARKEHDADFVNTVLTNHGETLKASLGKSLSAVVEENYDSIITALEAGPQAEQSSDEPEDDDFEDEDDLGDEVPNVDAVKAALKAYAKETGREEAKEIMLKHGASALSKVSECSDKQLIAMFKELV